MVAGSTLFGTREILVSQLALFGTLKILVAEPALFGTVRTNIMAAQHTHHVLAKLTLFGTSDFIFLHHLATLPSLSYHFHINISHFGVINT